MSRPWLDQAVAGVGRAPVRGALAGCAIGAATVAASAAAGRTGVALGSLAASWLFFAGLAVAAVALSAAVRLVEGGWAATVLPLAEACGAFFLPALALLVVLAPGLAVTVPWHAAAGPAHQAALVARVLLAALIVFGAGWRYLSFARDPEREPGRVRAAGVVYLLAALAGLSVWAWSIAADRAAGPTLTALPAWYVVGSIASGVAWIALAAVLRGAAPGLRHDLGKLLFAFALLWAYLLWSIYLPTWYGGVPVERALLDARWRGPWKPVASAVLLSVGAAPFCILFTERGKRGRGTLALAGSAVLAGVAAERHLVVLPALSPMPGLVDLGIALGVACAVGGVFVLSVATRLAPLTLDRESSP